MSEDKLVSALVHDLTPVSVKKPIRTTVVSFGISLVSTLIVFKLLFSIRSDLQSMVTNQTFLFSTFLALIVSLFGFFSVIFFSTPGRNVSYFLFFLVGSMLSLFFFLFSIPNETLQDNFTNTWHCTMGVLLLGVISFCIFGYAVKKRAVGNPDWAGVLCGVASACVGMSFLAFSCPNENSLHLLAWHLLLPLILFSSTGYLLGRKFFRW